MGGGGSSCTHCANKKTFYSKWGVARGWNGREGKGHREGGLEIY